MCGISGFVTRQPFPAGSAVLERMTSTIRHRGPDEHGYRLQNNQVFIGHRRLSIVDLATGQQPMTNEDGSVWLVYNGEIFNHETLRPALERAGHVYKTRSDTEMILHAWEEYGAECVHRFRGMYAFALWDQNKATLFCARDRMGKKPFYYYFDGQTLVFASEIKALLEHPEVRAELRPESLPEYLTFGYLSDRHTLFRNIYRLPAGHVLEWQPNQSGSAPAIRAYWDIPVPDRDPESRSEQEWTKAVRAGLEESVQLRLMSDVPLGMFLSGGVDSSAIAALIRKLSPGPLNTFSVGYREAKYSELGYAGEVARALGTTHHEVVLGQREFFDALPALIWHEDEPIVWPSSVPLFFVAQKAVEKVKVVLTGEGADELFGGYARYGWTRWNLKAAGVYGRLPLGLRTLVRSQVANAPWLKADLRRKLSHTVLGREATIESLYLDNFYGAFSRQETSRLLSHPGGDPFANFLGFWNTHPKASLLRRMLYADQKTYLAELLMKQDQMSMAASLESRVPFLDHEFASFAMRVPDNLKIRGREQKYILKRAVEDLLPHSIIYRRKMGFPTPLKQWLGDRSLEPLLAATIDRNSWMGAWLDLDWLRSLVDRHRAGTEDATDRLWRILNLQIWGDLFLSGQPASAKERWEAGRFLARAH